MIDALSQHKLDASTIVAVTSDHGVQLGRKGKLFKNVPWEETARVPLLLRAPGYPGGHGEVAPQVCSIAHNSHTTPLLPYALARISRDHSTRDHNTQDKTPFLSRPYLSRPRL